MSTLLVLSDLGPVGRLERRRNGLLQFTYDEQWRLMEGSFPVSCRMPVTRALHLQEQLLPWLRGLISENRAQLDDWCTRLKLDAKALHSSPPVLFDFLSKTGTDLAGALSFIPLRRARQIKGPVPAESREAFLKRFDKKALSSRLDALADKPGTARLTEDKDFFCLSGAQPKTALYRDKRGWALPQGPVPTTHILKPPALPYDGLAENEHLCLLLARLSGLEAASSEILKTSSGQSVLAVERFDRLESTAGLLRLHQEDLCQAMGYGPEHKYELDGGPSAVALYSFIKDVSDNPADPDNFLKALAFNWAIGGIDNHARNHALLLAHGHQTLLAPLYDLISIAPYKDIEKRRLSLHIGNKIKIGRINRRQWHKLAAAINLTEDAIDQLVSGLLNNLLSALKGDVFDREVTRLDHKVGFTLRDELIKHTEKCINDLNS
ncbi:HipA domain-containing protein [Kiloniella sp. b19]|uniref:HipA domain-containing protein n=1 Tax=Kiloniella sp. GXU_MW_B19 TaxID=3141326 RepID=UPI0031DFC6B7